MDTLTSAQVKIGKEIEAVINAYHNDLPDKKNLIYLREKLTNLDKLWSQFEFNDFEIRKYKNFDDHQYSQTQYYDKVYDGYETCRSQIVQLIEHVTEPQGEKGAISKSIITNTTSASDTHGTSLQEKTTGSSSAQGSSSVYNNVNDNELLKRLIRRQNFNIRALHNALRDVNIVDDNSKQYYVMKTESIKQYWNQIVTVNSEIWESTEDVASLGYDLDTFFRLEGEVQQTLITIQEKLDQIANIDHTNVNTNTTGQSLIKLPKISLPKFDGNYLKWRQFHDLFVQMVHNQPMGPAQKMWYLKANLTGGAEKLIRHLTVTDSNYHIAWETLINRYENKRLMVAALLDRLMTQPTISNESAVALKTLHDTTKECLSGLQNLNLEVEGYWDPIIMHIITKKLDRQTHALFEQSLRAPQDLQSVEELLKFVETRFQALEALGQKQIIQKDSQSSNKASVLMTSRPAKIQCAICQQSHAIYFCEQFKKMTAQERNAKIRELKLCLNCLKTGHLAEKCSSRSCLKCGKKHNTLLHVEQKIERTINNQTLLTAQVNEVNNSYVFLGTALVDVFDKNGQPIPCRLLLDSGSQMNLITERLQKKLNLTNTQVNMDITGVGENKLKIKDKLNIVIKSKFNSTTTELEVYVINEIGSKQPQQYINVEKWDMPKDIKLADPQFNRPQRVDILVGAELYGELMRNGQLKLNEGLPTLQNTVLGWVVLGKVSSIDYKEPFCGITTLELENQLQQFWALEECPETRKLSASDCKCEEFFESTTSRDTTGRFIVNLPILTDPKLLGDSKQIAFKRLLSMEKKLQKDSSLRKQYCEFLDEYLSLGHMQEIDARKLAQPYCFLPHHYVLKPSSSTTKLRVVFDASAKTTNNLSLNDIMLNGPKIQDDLMTIVLRFRTKRYVFTADINKMYRQIRVAEEDQNLQLIMWRKDPSEMVKYYRLSTVTYGTKAAPYLAVKCLQKLADEGGHRYPLGAAAIKDFYMDDVMSGSNNIEEAVQIQAQLRSLLLSAGFELRKWCANHPKLIDGIPSKDLEVNLNFTELEDEKVKTLGLVWHPVTDLFKITTALKEYKSITKRTVLADVSQIFDPLGLINPVVVMGKIFLQKLWKLKLEWDEELPIELHTSWIQFRKDLSKLNEINFPRYMFSTEDTRVVELHAFADASERAYGSALYLRSRDKSGKITVRLLCAKSRVAPVKPTTIPRLELCAAKLTAKLVNYVKETLGFKTEDIYYWTDSQIVISWLQGDPSVLKTFVANRVAHIQEMTDQRKWRYISTQENPADLVSRGLPPGQLKTAKIWFEGPEFLSLSSSKWPQRVSKSVRVEEEEKSNKLVLTATMNNMEHPLYSINHGNSFKRLQHVMAYILRAVDIFKPRGKKRRQNRSTLLTVAEIDQALQAIIKQVQKESFKDEICAIQRQKQLSKNSKLIMLAPFMDANGLLRVGGRLEQADIGYNVKHPLLVPADHVVTKLLMTHLHNTNLHAGPQALHAISRQNYWILQGRNIARSVVANCVRCAKLRPRLITQQMGDLPADRIQRARPFINCGVDFCGPIYTHFKIRGKRPQKSYISVFCCFATKAIHLEVVSDLTTDAFVGALKRFIARRGRCEKIYCDNATNFVGAKNQLQELEAMLKSTWTKEKIANMCLENKIQFHFIPPRSPHFGGLWEAAVKSTKSLLFRTIGTAALTYEELCTVTTEIEAVLNSRPLIPLSSDPNDLKPLTPAHFLIGEPLTSTVDAHSNQSKMSLLSRWQLVSYLRDEFWKRWSEEYLNELQKRAKWRNQHPNIQPGTLVTLKNENLPPLRWAMGRIVETIPGRDGNVRVADVKTSTGIYRRAIHTLAPLPVELLDEQEEPSTQNNMDTDAEEHQSEKDKKDNDERPRKRRRPSGPAIPLQAFLLTVLLLPLIAFATPITSTTSSLIEIEELTNRTGIYFEHIGQSHVVTNHWNLLVYYDLTGYKATITAIRQAMNNLKRVVSLISHNENFEEITRQYRHQLEEITNNDILITAHNNSRKKRSPLNLVGTIANKLFGVLDEEYANKMAEIIQNVEGNENYLQGLIKNQTSVLETTVNIIRKDEKERLKQISDIENGLEIVYDNLRNVSSDIKQQKIIQNFHTLSIFTAALINECKFIQNSILDIITDTHHGRANSLIISPIQLQEQIAIIKENLHTMSQLPTVKGQLAIPLLYKLMTVQYRLVGNYVIFNLKLPLVSVTKFELYQLLSLPVWLNGTFVTVNARLNFVMSNMYRDKFYLMTESEFAQCTVLNNNEFICDQHRPIENKASKGSTCEIGLFLQNSLSTTCGISITPPNDVWIQLHTKNHWLYSLTKEYQFSFVCANNFIHKILRGIGLLKMHSNCIMKNDQLTLTAVNNIESQLSSNSFQPMINLTWNDIQDNNETVTPLRIHHELKTHEREFESMNKELNSIKSNQNHLRRLQPHDIHQFTIGYTSLGVIAVIMIYLLTTCWRNRSTTFNVAVTKPQPKPRTKGKLDTSAFQFEVQDFKRGQDVESHI